MPYNPQRQGIIERTDRTLKLQILKNKKGELPEPIINDLHKQVL